MQSPDRLSEIIIEEKVIQSNGETRSRYYTKGNQLGKSGSSRLFEMLNNETKVITAGKVIEKSTSTKDRTRQNLMREIKIIRSLHHKGIANFEHFFEDDQRIYILLDICKNGTLNEVLKRRIKFTEIEVQCYLIQLLEVLQYLHSLKIIHRNIKLSNLFLNEKMELKLGEFGFACKIKFDGERKRSICGNIDLIAPEILDGQNGYSYEVDIWNFGIIAYTMLVGKPPFQGDDIRSSYRRIKANDHYFPNNVFISNEAKQLIVNILVAHPNRRLTLNQIREHPFFTRNFIPETLPLSTIYEQPSGSFLKQFEIKREHKINEELSKCIEEEAKSQSFCSNPYSGKNE